MPDYYLSKELSQNFEFEIHKDDCLYLPDEKSRKHIGFFNNSQEALNEATKTSQYTNGCYWCCKSIHNGRIPFAKNKK
ncbi:hypothetical protein [uncultured Planktosalinus sp.]|uniref:hypothetical protein n=1 Tax=uncultured Planktosalinus sp. TaxID=1810935 RepID=UPI0030DBFA13